MSNLVYVASSWRNDIQPLVIKALRESDISCYDFKNPERNTGFSWREVMPEYGNTIRTKGTDWVSVHDYLRMVYHPRAISGFQSDYDAMLNADSFVLVLPCGKSAHLELGWAVGMGKRTAILLEDPVEPELMYRMVEYMTSSIDDIVAWALKL